MSEYFAHSFEGRSVEEWHRLEKHLIGAANLAKGFADEFGDGDLAYWVGLWHDFGINSNGD
ncbi:MAG: hypothetical protein DCC43_08235 [Candidatus Brocadia sp.]|nr:hypothetical protein [Anaerolineales bacterium]MCC6324197.1 hypothetical protein [Candidatus Brocadia sp.]MCE7911788.1 hypothetical protein [Candidatus Brocadia sp. AMX3]MDG5995970.1 hypothetical protein [Candidatus Brocadia sp.]RIJ99537.1 MAG: hypothetical protein DCC43_08235 [Candidatus Brocadia sp.]